MADQGTPKWKREDGDVGEREEKTVLHEKEEENGSDKKEGPSQVTPPPSAYHSETDRDGEDVDPQVWKNYFKQIKESEGFDIVDFPGVSMSTRIVPVTHINEARFTHELVVKLAKLAITNYNTQHEDAYEFIDLEKANARVVEGVIYYITFRVRNLKAAGNVVDGGKPSRLEFGIG